jgi:tetratricopeptide (TPR) repeat protein
MSVALFEKGDHDVAVEWFEHVLEANPNDDVTMKLMSVSLAFRGDWVGAFEHIAKAARLDPDAWKEDFWHVCAETGRDADEEWAKLFPG